MKIKNLVSMILLIPLTAALVYIVYLSSAYEIPEPEPTDDLSHIEASAPPIAPESLPPETPEPPEETADLMSFPDRPVIDVEDWMYMLVNTDNVLPRDFEPELTSLEGEQLFDSRASEALSDMISAARSEGLSVILTSSYRSYDTQQYLFDNKLQEKLESGLAELDALEAARQIVAYPGTSEHQLGLAADIVDKSYEYMNESLADTELSKWLAENCADHGFILRYPEDKQEITGIMFEPWHFRYVGREAAGFIMENGLCLEEFVLLYE